MVIVSLFLTYQLFGINSPEKSTKMPMKKGRALQIEIYSATAPFIPVYSQT